MTVHDGKVVGAGRVVRDDLVRRPHDDRAAGALGPAAALGAWLAPARSAAARHQHEAEYGDTTQLSHPSSSHSGIQPVQGRVAPAPRPDRYARVRRIPNRQRATDTSSTTRASAGRVLPRPVAARPPVDEPSPGKPTPTPEEGLPLAAARSTAGPRLPAASYACTRTSLAPAGSVSVCVAPAVTMPDVTVETVPSASTL